MPLYGAQKPDEWTPLGGLGRPVGQENTAGARKDEGGVSQEIEYQRFLQYVFQHEWLSLKDYANRRGIRIVGDMPIYADADSCDTWAHRACSNWTALEDR